MIVVATFKTKDENGNDVFTDTYTKVDTIEEAQEIYQEFLDRDELHTASICGVIESTDYRPTLINSKIDYNLLKEQKALVVTLSEQFDMDSDFGMALEGVLNLLDGIQDEALSFGWEEEE